MIGCIVTGHGSFAPGMKGALEMIAGPQEHFEMVAFSEEEPFENFETKMQETLTTLLTECQEVLIFADLLGGTPFKTAMLLAQENPTIQVIAGANLPSIIECTGLRYADPTLEVLIKGTLEAGKSGLLHPQLTVKADAVADNEEGI